MRTHSFKRSRFNCIGRTIEVTDFRGGCQSLGKALHQCQLAQGPRRLVAIDLSRQDHAAVATAAAGRRVAEPLRPDHLKYFTGIIKSAQNPIKVSPHLRETV